MSSSQESNVWSFSAVGRDRPGIVAALSEVFFTHNCNLLDSSMTILGGQFAVVMLLETGPETDGDKLGQALQEMGKTWHLKVAAGPVESGQDERHQLDGPSHLVSVYGADQAGITWKVAQLIAKHHFNVTDLSTRRIEGSAPVYILLIEIVKDKEQADLAALKKELTVLGGELGCSVSIKEVESASL